MNTDTKKFLVYEVLKTSKEIDEIKSSNLSEELKENLARTWGITYETYVKDLYTDFIAEAMKVEVDDEKTRIRRGLACACDYIRNMSYKYDELAKEFQA